MFRQPEVQHLHVAVARNHNVFGLEIAMYDAGGVRRRERIGDLDGGIQGFPRRQTAPLEDARSDSPSTNSETM